VAPEATDRETLIERLSLLAAPAAVRGWLLRNRLHVLICNDELGR